MEEILYFAAKNRSVFLENIRGNHNHANLGNFLSCHHKSSSLEFLDAALLNEEFSNVRMNQTSSSSLLFSFVHFCLCMHMNVVFIYACWLHALLKCML